MTKTKRKKSAPSPSRPYWEMTLDELREATKEFDGPMDLSDWRPLTRAERARHDRAMKGPVRSIFIHQPDESGKRRVTVLSEERTKSKLEIELTQDLLKHCNDYASKHDLTISEVIAMSLKTSFVFAE